MKKIKILFHTNPNSETYNAQNLNGKEIAKRLDPNKFDIYFINIYNSPIDQKLIKKNIHIIDISKKNFILKTILFIKYKVFKKYDISFYVRTFWEESMFLILIKLFNKKRKLFHLVENRLPYPANKIYNFFAKLNTHLSTNVYAISEVTYQDCTKKFNRKPNGIIPVGVDTSLFKPNLSKKNKRLKIISIGTFQERKRPKLFAEIAKKFPQQDFYWIGEGKLKKLVIEKKKKENINNLYILNNMDHNKLSKFLANCDVFLFPSIHEGFPKVIIEAMASGLPVIACNKYGPEAIINKKTGFIVSSQEDIINKLKLLIENKNLREEFSKNAIERAKEFDWNNIVKLREKELLS